MSFAISRSFSSVKDFFFFARWGLYWILKKRLWVLLVIGHLHYHVQHPDWQSSANANTSSERTCTLHVWSQVLAPNPKRCFLLCAACLLMVALDDMVTPRSTIFSVELNIFGKNIEFGAWSQSYPFVRIGRHGPTLLAECVITTVFTPALTDARFEEQHAQLTHQ